jgi:ubiquinone/menaquinone biosynthesis C-methylase UbiE
MSVSQTLLDAIDPLRVDPVNVGLATTDNPKCLDLTPVSVTDSDMMNSQIYDTDTAVQVYKNFLNWMFSTFKTSEVEFRKSCIEMLNLKAGDKVLVTSCGLGDDVEACRLAVGPTGIVHAQDLSKAFINYASGRNDFANVFFTISNALDLPYKDGYFDAVYHFGGINCFGDMPKAISEMSRVCKVGGMVAFGDESVAEHLRDLDYGKMAIKNNRLWDARLPLKELPPNALDITVKYVLGNCFYLISFVNGSGLPDIDPDIVHIGYRGGTMRTRYFGGIESVSPATRDKIYAYAKKHGTSVYDLLEKMINEQIP